MLQQQGHRLCRWFAFFTFIAVSSLTLQCCGSGLTRGETKSLELFLEIPQGEDPSLFWFGVQRKVLRWKPSKGEMQEIEWDTRAKISWDPNEGDKMEFHGSDGSGRLVVFGEAQISEEKKATISLRRIL